MSNDLIPVEVIENNTKIDEPRTLKIEKNQINTDDFIDLELLLEDYNRLREVVLQNTNYSKKIIEALTVEMFSGDGVSPEMISSYSSLINTMNTSLKILTDSYKNISNVLMNINKLNSNKPKSSEESKEDTAQIINLKDVLAKLRTV